MAHRVISPCQSTRGPKRTVAFAVVSVITALMSVACEEAQTTHAPLEKATVTPLPIDVEIDTSRRSTDGAIAVRNLNAGIEGAKAHWERTGLASSRARLVQLLSLRASMNGTYDDFQTIDQLTTEALQVPDPSADALLERADHLASVHRFGEARAMLDRAEASGAAESGLRGRA